MVASKARSDARDPDPRKMNRYRELRRHFPSIGWRRVARSAEELPLGSLTILLLFLGMVVFANLVAPRGPLEVSLPERLQPPVFAGGTWRHVLGTDANGRDILSRIIFGARIDLPIAGISLALAASFGTTVGLVSGYVGGHVDRVLMRSADLTIIYPPFLVAILLAVVRGPNASNVVIAVAVTLWARFARVVRGDVLSIRERDFIALAKVAGCSHTRIMTRHILPNVLSSVILLAALQVGWVIILSAALGFLGAGVPPPAPSWGTMISGGRAYITTAWWIATMPGLAIVLAVLGFNLFGDWLRDRLDPKFHGKRTL